MTAASSPSLCLNVDAMQSNFSHFNLSESKLCPCKRKETFLLWCCCNLRANSFCAYYSGEYWKSFICVFVWFFKENVKGEVLSRSTKKVVCGFSCTSRRDTRRGVDVRKSDEKFGDVRRLQRGETQSLMDFSVFFSAPAVL